MYKMIFYSPASIYGGREYVAVNFENKDYYFGNTASTGGDCWSGFNVAVKNRRVLEMLRAWLDGQGFENGGRK